MAAEATLFPVSKAEPMSRCWLMKSEPNTYSIDDLARDGRTYWDGVRNYQARNLMREMKVGDRVLYYHSNASPPGVVGLARVVKEAYPDPSARDPESHYYDEKATEEDPRWYMVDIEFVERLPQFVPLADLKDAEGLDDMVVTKRSRLSVQPVTPREFDIVCRMGGKDAK
jgi:predicted RNA-binding protein with PUA-like domain